jgi:hypothetical protein
MDVLARIGATLAVVALAGALVAAIASRARLRAGRAGVIATWFVAVALMTALSAWGLAAGAPRRGAAGREDSTLLLSIVTFALMWALSLGAAARVGLRARDVAGQWKRQLRRGALWALAGGLAFLLLFTLVDLVRYVVT